ncbi:carboxymuconolactone decarboxylase family protein [Novosphingobium sp. NDB2Meth1]|uniref:carboxymuconolactone decarboxylase family protein n=1 Tax=Novosphingobium sp. NDB2Meth1 TaxID=1892847 RepID=UPI0009FAF3AA|nr:carboxymuconolactone decarboxylase family protein [Novosphingobium sp. NDB2Meth1]
MTARIAPLPPRDAAPAAAAHLDTAKRKTGMVPNAYRVMAHSPALLGGYLALAESLDGGALPRRLREQIALAIAASNACDYCLAAHRIGGRFARLSAAEIAAAEAGQACDAREAVALRLALALRERVGDVDDALLEEARAAGFSDADLVEIAGHVALNVLTNTINRFARTPNDFESRTLKVATEVMVRLGAKG